MPEFDKAKLDQMMERIRKLLERADHPNTPAPEAAESRRLAEKIMVKYRIEEEHLIKSGDLKSDVINVQDYIVPVAPLDSEFRDVYQRLASYAAHHTGCTGVFKWDYSSGNYVMHLFGYEGDIRYTEALFNAARMLFADRMEPKPHPDLSDEDNVYRMRSAGMERIRIAAMMGYGTTNSATAKVTRLYKKACAERGEDPTLTGRGNNVKNFRDVYTSEFTDTFWYRLYNARNAVEAEIQEGGLVLHDREGRVKEAMYKVYPHLRPKEATTPAKYKAPTAAQLRAAERRAEKDAAKRFTAAGRAGANAGRRAAEEVQIKGHTPKRRLEN